MTRDEKRLVRHLVIAVALKLALLAALWWLFVRDARVSVSLEQVAPAVVASSLSQGARP